MKIGDRVVYVDVNNKRHAAIIHTDPVGDAEQTLDLVVFAINGKPSFLYTGVTYGEGSAHWTHR